MPIGMNTGIPSYYDGIGLQVFSNHAAQMGQWTFKYHDWSGEPDSYRALRAAEENGLVDENGYPIEVPMTIPGVEKACIVECALPNNFHPGRYVILYDGVGELDFYDAGILTIVSEEPGRVVIDAKLWKEGNHFAFLRVIASEKGNHLRNIRILAEADAHSWSPSNPWHIDFLKAVNQLDGMRFMGWSAINEGTTHPGWEHRVSRNHYTQGSSRGVSYDMQIDLCNRLKIDGWFCIPHMADDNYIRAFAELVRDNMDPALRVFVEYSNEVWNWAGPYPQSHYVGHNGRLAGSPEWDCADSIYNTLRAIGAGLCGGPDEYCHPEKDAYMMQRVFRIWRSVFTGADRSRLTCVAAGQVGWADNTGRILAYLYNDEDRYTNLGSTGEGCDAIASAPYFTAAQSLDEWKEGLLVHGELARSYGVEHLCYEGGPEAHQGAIWADGREMYDKYIETFRLLASPEINCTAFFALGFRGELDNYGHVRYLPTVQDEATMPLKWKALVDVSPREPLPVEQLTPARHAAPRAAAITTRHTTHRPRVTIVSGTKVPSRAAAFSLDGRRITGRHAGPVRSGIRIIILQAAPAE